MYLKKIEDGIIVDENDLLSIENLGNDILIRKIKVDNKKYVQIKENECVVLYNTNKILDQKDESGIYEIVDVQNMEKTSLENWNFEIQKAEDEESGLLYINTAEIVNNKFYIKNPITYTDWSYEEEPFESKVKVEGIFNFKIIKPENFLKIVIGLREHYSKPELLEQVRNYILKSIEEGIKELSEVFKIDISTFVNKIHELDIKVSQNNYDEKLLSKGIKVTYFDLNKIDVDEETKIMLEIEEKYKSE